MRYQREFASFALCAELSPLLKKHYLEIAHYPDIELSPNFETYVKIEETGGLRVYTARSDEGELVGYAIYFVKHNIHYSGSLQAVQDVLFVDPDHRGTGARLIKYADECLKAEGVQVTYQHVKTKHNFGPLLERMGYELVDLIYARRLDQ